MVTWSFWWRNWLSGASWFCWKTPISWKTSNKLNLKKKEQIGDRGVALSISQETKKFAKNIHTYSH